MNNLETQLRHYAVAVAGPAHHDHAEPHEDLTPTRGRRAGFAVAAGVLVALAVAAGVVVATRSHQTTAASATTEANGLQVRLDVNTTTPGPTDQVTAKMTATNVSAEPIATRTLCPSNVTIEPAATPGPPVAASPPLSPPEALAQWFNPMIQGAILHGVGDAGTPSDPPCNREQTTLNPGAHLSVVATVTPGTLGLDPVPMHIVARYWPMGTVNPAWLPFTVPSPPGKASRSSAIAVTMARPEVQQWANQAMFGAIVPAPASSTGDGTTRTLGSSSVFPDDGGWQINVTVATHTLKAHINADGTTGSTTADGTTTTF